MPDWSAYFLKMKKLSNANWILTANLPRNSLYQSRIITIIIQNTKQETKNPYGCRKAMTTVKACDRVHIRMRRKGQSEKPQHRIQEVSHILLPDNFRATGSKMAQWGKAVTAWAAEFCSQGLDPHSGRTEPPPKQSWPPHHTRTHKKSWQLNLFNPPVLVLLSGLSPRPKPP